jgi:DNA helicase-2/ATP-dependent DNA helicase PcrA
MASPRPHQQDVLDYDGGTMGVSAVPGSGKTWTLTRLAARIVSEADLDADQEVLVVTLVNASVDNFSTRIGELIEERGLLPGVGYRVCTLHTLAHEIVRARPDLVGLAEDFHVVDQRQGSQILGDVVQSWYRSNQSLAKAYLTDDIGDWKRKKVLSEDLPTALRHVAQNAIKYAKSRSLSPEGLRERLGARDETFRLADMAAAVYRGYQKALNVQNAVDFDDLIRHALEILRLDEALVERLRHQWPVVLEDEAQDSSEIQERILRRIVGVGDGAGSDPSSGDPSGDGAGDAEGGNWVRVGDPNQAIYESFTTADPNLLRDFVEEAEVSHALPTSGRSQPSIIKLANRTIWWASTQHPNEHLRGALSTPYIRTTPEGDPQPNPPDRPDRVAFVGRPFTEEREIEVVADALQRWLPDHPDKTAAILVPVRSMGQNVVAHLEQAGIPYTDTLLKTTPETRKTARKIERVVEYLAKPASAVRLAHCYVHWCYARADELSQEEIKAEAGRLAGLERVEAYVWPRGDEDWLEAAAPDLTTGERKRLEAFRERVRYWLGLSGLPVGQLVMAVARDLLGDPQQIALAQRFGGLLRRASSYNPEWGLPEFSEELEVIASNQRRFEGVGGSETEFNPDEHRGEVTVSTMHGAKGLEWDRVHMLGVNDYHFPAARPGDSYTAEKWYFRDALNLQAETLAQIDALVDDAPYHEGDATLEARREYARERIRLFYVCVTRAREELMVSTNIGRFESNEPALIFEHMKAICDEHVTA